MIHSQPDFIMVIARFRVHPQAFTIYDLRLLSRKMYFFAAFHLTPTAGEPEISTASKPFPIVSKKFLQTPDFDVVTVVTYTKEIVAI